MEYKFEVGQKIIPKSTFSVQNLCRIRAIHETKGEKYAWISFRDNTHEGKIVNLDYYQPYFEPGFYQNRGLDGKDRHGVTKWYENDPDHGNLADVLVRVNVEDWEDDDYV